MGAAAIIGAEALTAAAIPLGPQAEGGAAATGGAAIAGAASGGPSSLRSSASKPANRCCRPVERVDDGKRGGQSSAIGPILGHCAKKFGTAYCCATKESELWGRAPPRSSTKRERERGPSWDPARVHQEGLLRLPEDKGSVSLIQETNFTRCMPRIAKERRGTRAPGDRAQA